MVLQSMIAVVRPVQDPAVRLARPGPTSRKVLPIKREEIRYRYTFQGRSADLRPQLLELALSIGAVRLPDQGEALHLRVPGEQFKGFTSKLLENLKFKVERERWFSETPGQGVELEIRFEMP